MSNLEGFAVKKEIRFAILWYMLEQKVVRQGSSVRLSELQAEMEYSPRTFHTAINEMIEFGVIERVGYGRYEFNNDFYAWTKKMILGQGV